MKKGRHIILDISEYNNENDGERSQEEIKECHTYVENEMKKFNDAFFNGIKD